MSADINEELNYIQNLRPGEKWGVYWKHADGWMRLYPPPDSTPPATDQAAACAKSNA